MPETARGWLCWAVSVSDRYTRPHSPKYEYDGFTDRRMSDRRETAISVKMLAEKASAKCSGNGVGYELMMSYYVGEASWHSFTEPEQRIIAKTVREFSRRLREAGLIEKKVRGSS